ncbi:MAG: protein kinase [Planctomycetota bacterium]
MEETPKQPNAEDHSAEQEIRLGGSGGEGSAPLYEGLPTGTGLGKYRILERLRTSHNAVVYRARDAMLDRLVTVKQMTPTLIDNPIACGHFKREAQFLARIPKDAQSVVNIHELIEEETGLFIVEEFVEGRWLESLIAKRMTDLPAAARLLMTIAQGLRTLHCLGIVHRAVQPSNIIVARNNKAKLANLSTAAHEGDTTAPPVIVPKYSAPELLDEAEYDDRVDIYSLGICLFEYCVGRRALHEYVGCASLGAASAVKVWTQWQTDMAACLPPASELNPQVPVELSAILARMTAKHLDERFATVEEVLDALLEIRGQRARQLGYRSRPASDRLLPPPEREARVQAYMLRAITTEAILSTPVPPGQVRFPVSTTKHTVRRHPERTAPSSLEGGTGTARTPTVPDVPTPLLPRVTSARRRPVVKLPPRPVEAEAIPTPQEVQEVHRERHPHLLAWILSAVFLFATVAAGGTWLWYNYMGPGLTHPIEAVVADGMAAYDHGEFELSKAKLLEATQMHANAQKFIQMRGRAEKWIYMVDAQLAVARNDFDAALQHLREAEKCGLDPAQISTLQRLCWTKRDTLRVAEEMTRDIEGGRLTDAELKLSEYRDKAEASGLDPSRVVDQVNHSRQDQKYQEILRRARAALEEHDFDQAFLACNDAERIRSTSETRYLHREITDAKERVRLIALADNAFLEKDFEAASKAYERANQIEATEPVETRARAARAYLLYEDAQEAIKDGDLIKAEKLLRSSARKFPTPHARKRLQKLAPAFKAARLVQRADRALERGDYATAIELYEEAIPRLPAPADTLTKEKLVRARQDRLTVQGDEACEARDWAEALRLYKEAKRLGRNGDIDKKIEAVEARLSR